MKKIIYKYIIFICILFASIFSNRSQQIYQQWVSIYNGNANSDDGAYKVKTDNQGNIYVVGYATRTGTNRDFLTIKYNPNGDTLWTRYYAGPATQFAYDYIVDAAIDDSNNVYVFGSSAGTNSADDFVTIKYNSSGTQQWLNRYSAGANTQLLAVVMKIDQQRNIYEAGYQGSSPATGYAYILKYNSNGVQQWIKTLRTDGASNVASMVLDNANNIYLTGNGYSLEESSFYAAKFNSNGDSLWCNGMGYSGMHGGIGSNDIKVDQNGNSFICGTADVYQYLQDHYYMITVKYNNSGAQQWYSKYPQNDTGGAQGHNINIDSYGNIYSSGSYNGSAAIVKYNNNGTFQWFTAIPNGTINTSIMDTLSNLYVSGYYYQSFNNYLTMKINSQGSIVWSISYPGPNNQGGSAQSIALDNNLNVIVTGNLNGTSSDIGTIKYNQLVGINSSGTNIPQTYTLYQNYPNPFNPTTKIIFDVKSNVKSETSNVKLIIYDIIGREVATLVNERLTAGTYEVEFNGSNCPSGVYFYKITATEFTETKKMIILK